MAERGNPTPGRIVLYQTDERGGLRYVLPAVITCTEASHPGNYPCGTENQVPRPCYRRVHLHVMTPGPKGFYTELDVPYDDSPEPGPRSWHWPPLVGA